MRRARYISLEGVEGVGKTTQCDLLVETLKAQGFQVLRTKEPGIQLLPITMALRSMMLDSQYNDELTVIARELISQTIRSIHIEKLVIPARSTYDYIVQDRGVLSGLSYGWACGNDIEWLRDMALRVSKVNKLYDIYDDIVVLDGNVASGLSRAQACKQEFKAGDAMEAKGVSFLDQVSRNMRLLSSEFPVRVVRVDGLDIQQVHDEIKKVLKLH